MDRRSMLKGLVATASGLLLPKMAPGGSKSYFSMQNRFGWVPNQDSLADFIRRNENPYISQQNEDIKGTGEGKSAFLWKALERVTGHPFVPHNQLLGDCVSHGFALSVDMLSAVQIIIDRLPQRWVSYAATEPIYGGSRIEIGGVTDQGGGSTGHWAAEWIARYGILLRKKYPGGFDFTHYDADKALKYGYEGCPDPLEPIAKLHPVKTVAICTSYSELRDCLYNGMPVAVCSDVGFGDRNWKRDKAGFLRRRRTPWYHCMMFGGYDDVYKRPGALCFNSWGCFDEQTEILTDQGWKLFKDLDRSEKVATLNKKHELEYQTPTCYHRYPYEGYLWHHKSRDIDFSVTPNHKLYFATRGSDKWKFARADECIQSVKFKKNAKNTKPDVKYHMVGDVKVSMDLWLEFLGYWLSEGDVKEEQSYFKGNKNGVQRRVSISQLKKENRKTIWKCLQQMPFKFNKYKKCFSHCCKSPLIKEMLPFGHAHEKYIPDYVWECSERQLKIFYEALMLGDGSVCKCPTGFKRTYYTSSKQLADDFQRLLLHCGLCGDISFTDRRGRKNGENNTTRHIEYRIGIKVKAFEQSVKYKPVLLPYEGEVFCVTVPNHTLYVRRNGRAVWMGNSDWVTGPTRNDQPEGTFWVDADTVDRMLRQGDSFALSAWVGFPKKALPPYILY